MATATANETSQTSLVATFQIADTHCGIDTESVQEVIDVDRVTPVHNAPSYIKGIVNLRGKIITILDVGRKLELPQTEVSEDSRIFVIDWQDEYIGLLVDRISDVDLLDNDLLKPPPANVGSIQGKYFHGVFNLNDRLVAMLNLDEVLSDSGE